MCITGVLAERIWYLSTEPHGPAIYLVTFHRLPDTCVTLVSRCEPTLIQDTVCLYRVI